MQDRWASVYSLPLRYVYIYVCISTYLYMIDKMDKIGQPIDFKRGWEIDREIGGEERDGWVDGWMDKIDSNGRVISNKKNTNNNTIY